MYIKKLQCANTFRVEFQRMTTLASFSLPLLWYCIASVNTFIRIWTTALHIGQILFVCDISSIIDLLHWSQNGKWPQFKVNDDPLGTLKQYWQMAFLDLLISLRLAISCLSSCIIPWSWFVLIGVVFTSTLSWSFGFGSHSLGLFELEVPGLSLEIEKHD